MRCLLCLVVLLGSIYGCKRTTSESKGWGPLGKKLAKAGKLSEEMKTAIRQAVKKSSEEGEVDDLKKLIAQGGKVSEEAILAYRRSFSDRTDEWLEQMGQIDKRISLLKEELPLGARINSWNYELAQEIRLAEHYTDEFLDVLEPRLFQIHELAYDTPSIADKLCCNSINFTMLEKNLRTHSGELADNFDRIRNILKAEQEFLADLRTKASTTKQTDQASKTASTATQQLSYDVQKLISDASNDVDFIAARLAIKQGLKNDKQAELVKIIDELLANNPAKVDQFYQSFTNRRFADIEHALIKIISDVTDSQGLYRTLDELLEDTKQLHKDLIDRDEIFKKIVGEDNLKVLQDNNRRYMVDGSKITKLPLSRRNSNLHWIEQLPKQVQTGVMGRQLGRGDSPKITGLTRAETRPRIVAIEKEIKAIKAICKGGLC